MDGGSDGSCMAALMVHNLKWFQPHNGQPAQRSMDARMNLQNLQARALNLRHFHGATPSGHP